MQVDLSLNGLVPSDISMNLPAATAMCFKGADASGKTNGIKILAFIIDFLTNSFAYKPKTFIHFDSYFLTKESSEIYLQFLFDDKEYLYEAELIKEKILSEKLTLDGKLVFQKDLNSIVKTIFIVKIQKLYLEIMHLF